MRCASVVAKKHGDTENIEKHRDFLVSYHYFPRFNLFVIND